MESTEHVLIRQCLRETHQFLGFQDYNDLAKALHALDSKIKIEMYAKYLRNQKVADKFVEISNVSRLFIKNNLARISVFYKVNERHNLVTYLESLTESVNDEKRERPGHIFDKVFHHWMRPVARGEEVLATGVYQTFRRHKPVGPEVQGEELDHDSYVDDDTIVISEVMFIDSESMECALITCSGHLYRGICYVDLDLNLSLFLHRPHFVSELSEHIYQRVYSSLRSSRET